MNAIDKTPKEIVKELNQYIVGQTDAKKAVAVALRNRYRRMQLPRAMQADITPKNLLMIGPTGVGKTEIARRLAKIVDAPFVKVEATKFTEVGYVGNSVESMVRDLVDNAVHAEKKKHFARVHDSAVQRADRLIVKLLVPAQTKTQQKQSQQNNLRNLAKMFAQLQKGRLPNHLNQNARPETHVSETVKAKRRSVARQLRQGLLENRRVKVWMNDPKQAVAQQNGMLSQMGVNLSSILPKRKISRTVKVSEARHILAQQEAEELVNDADIYHDAIQRAENTGIIFIDEIDKITGAGNKQNRGEVSREGVQRDILPIVEGTEVKTRYGMVDTSHILFIASGAFADSKPSDLIAELQGRFPIRVKLNPLSEADFVKILTEPKDSLIKQYVALISTDNIKVTFTIESVKEIAKIAYDVNRDTENIGARRLQTILEKLLEDLLYEGPDMEMGHITITQKYVERKVGRLAKNQKLSRYIL